MKWQPNERKPALSVPPPDAASLDEAHLAIEQWEYYKRRRLDDVQRLAVEYMMAEAPSGLWCARTTGRAESRQNGKGDELEVVESYGILQRGEAILHSAHEIPTTRSAQERLVAFLEGHRDLRNKIGHVKTGNAERSIEIRGDGGGIIVYRTRTAGGGRGLDDISRLVVDEAQEAKPEELASSTPVLAANPNPQTNFTGSGGIARRSTWWWEVRLRALHALAGTAPAGQFSYLENSAEEVWLDDEGNVQSKLPDPADIEAWKRANPAYPSRISHEYLEEQLRLLKAELFGREHLCIWDPLPDPTGQLRELDRTIWHAAKDPSSGARGSTAIGIDVGTDADTASIGAAGTRPDGNGHIEVIECRSGTDWVAPMLDGILKLTPRKAVAIDAAGPVGQLLPDIRRVCKKHTTKLLELSTRDYAAGCGELTQAIRTKACRHRGQGWLDAAVANGRRRSYADQWIWDRRVSGDITALVACTVARRALMHAGTDDERSIYEDDDIFVA